MQPAGPATAPASTKPKVKADSEASGSSSSNNNASGDGAPGDDAAPVLTKISCDRIHPCEQCRRYGKTCVFPEAEVPRRGKKYIAEVEDRVERLERLLAEHAPHALEASPSLDDELRRRIPHHHHHHHPHPHPHPHPSPRVPISPTLVPNGIFAHPGNPAGDRRHSTASSTLPTPPTGPPSGGMLPPPSVSPTSSLFFEPHGGGTHAPPAPPPPHHLSPASRVNPQASFETVASTADAYERQPRNALGYEWDERKRGTTHENDGTASLSVDPDGEGYLGFASGSTLLSILQIVAGGISLSHIPPSAEPAPPENWKPTHAEMSRYIDAYFEHYHTQYPIIHESTFRAQYAEVIPRPPRAQWLVLVHVVIGLGAICSSAPMYIVDYFLERSIAVITVDHLETGSLTLVQAFTLLSNLAQKRNKSNAGSVYLGIAVRMAIGLGLHRELPLWNIKPFEREVRRRVWWVVFIFDAGASVTFGRPILLPYGSADVKMIHNVQDRDFTPSAPAVPPASSDTTIYTSLIYQASFHLCANRIYERVISTPPPSGEEVLELDHDIRQWHATIPKWFASPVTHDDHFRETPWLHFSAHKLFWRYCNLRIILHRRAFLERALQRLPLSAIHTGQEELEHTLSSYCLQSAMDTIYDIHDFFKGRKLNTLEKWYGLHFLFQSSFVPLIALWTDVASPDRAAWQEAVRQTRETLMLRGVQTDPLAERCLRIIDLLTPPVQPDNVPTDVNALLDLFTANPQWQDAGDVAHQLLPYADLATLMTLWPSSQP
ncbi:hypothetical protein Q8F55_006213 [Vanrija albida]|uniref:Xylanolytic transcriptional activator regulatory domain-containing protein n=1 Tax=Vanrija albida TaxID=181172 RepID=A0ABR3PWI0_9TREE